MADQDDIPQEAEGTDEEARAAQGPRFDAGSGWGAQPSAEAAAKVGHALAAEAVEWELPDAYGVDRVLLLGRDPRWAFLYWELTQAGRAALEARVEAEAGAGERRWELRWGDGDAPWGGPPPGRLLADSLWDRGEYYAALEGPARPLRAWVGVTARGARFYPLCASPVVDFRDFAPVAERPEEAREVWRGPHGAPAEAPRIPPESEALFRDIWLANRGLVQEDVEIDAWGSIHLIRRRILKEGAGGAGRDQVAGSDFGGSHAAPRRPTASGAGRDD